MDDGQRLEFYPIRSTRPTPTDLLSLADAKAHLRVDVTAEDDLITDLIGAALDTCQQVTGRYLGSTSATLYADGWKNQAFTFGPVTAISKVEYYNQANTLTELPAARWWADLESTPQRITFDAPPAIYTNRHQGVKVSATLGEGTIPRPMRQAALLLVGHYYENRQQVVTGSKPEAIPMAVDFLLNPFRVWP